MDEERKIKCHCGKALLEEKETDFHNFKTKALVCSRCKFTTLTKEQANKYLELRKEMKAWDSLSDEAIGNFEKQLN